jgi:glycosyltransferase involved in cell wall biosynthesis
MREQRVLMIAYHFPPLAGSSGIQRTLRFVQQLGDFGWRPLVLSADPRAYERTSDDLSGEIPEGTVVRRAFALDTGRHLSWRGRYVAAMARPDRWMSWRYDAVRQGMALVRQFKPTVIWSTYPIATAHLIGADIQHRTGLPWVADFRDPMAQDDYPADAKTHQQYVQIEHHALLTAAASTFTSPGAAAEYRQRYPTAASRVHVLENGYDEETFTDIAEQAGTQAGPLNPGAKTLLHSGIVYPSERDPTQLMVALRRLHESKTVVPGALKVRFRAAVAEELLHRLASDCGVEAYVEILPPVSYRKALVEMLRADALLIMQASNCNAQIPAKLYEYLRARRPILCLSDPAGDTAGALRVAGVTAVARLDDAQSIERLIRQFLLPDGAPLQTLANDVAIQSASRRGRSQALADLLQAVAKGGAAR